MSMAGIGNRRTLSEKIGELVEYGVLKVENQYNNKTHSRMANKYTLVAV